MSDSNRRVAYDGQLFRVEHQPIPGRQLPYEFARRIGAVSVFSIVFDDDHGALVLAVTNERTYYGTSDDLPGGNQDGGFDDPEPVAVTALRELREETGYGYADGAEPQLTILRLRDSSKTVNYPRHLVVARGVTYIGGEEKNPREIISARLVPLEGFLEPLYGLSAGNLYPEMNAAFARAAMQVGKPAVAAWLADASTPVAEQVVASFRPWLIAE